MKSNSAPPVVVSDPTEDDIRDYAYHLFVQTGGVSGHDIDNWLEAKACLCACVPKSESHARLHRHTKNQKITKAAALRPKNAVAA